MTRILSTFFVCVIICANIRAQDKIVKTNGDTLSGKVMEIGTNAISFKKASIPNGPIFTELKSEILMIIFANGTVEYISKKPDVKNISNNNIPSASGTNTITPAQPGQKNKIEMSGGKYYINGQKAKQKEVNTLLASSKNPAITLPLKAAKLTKTFQKIVKITSIPTTVGGGTALLVSGIDLINDVRRTRDNSKTYINFFSSVFATFSLPVTNKILKKKSDKMYGKIIDIYNVTN
ncbi:MAG: hypothetical protein ACXVPN_09650 [Bacteroidia bacterium]